MSTSSNFVPNFSTSSNGFKFSNNEFQKAALFRLTGVIIPFPGHGISIGDASNGLCGGMVFAARDYWQIHQHPPADTQNPGPGNPLFDYLVQRLFDSFGIAPDHPPSIGASAWRYWQLMVPTVSDHDTVLGPHVRAWIMIKEEWPKIRSDIDNGVPSPIGLILVKSMNPADMVHHHQVLVYGL